MKTFAKYSVFLIVTLLMACKSIKTENEISVDSKNYRLKDVLYAKKSISAGQISNNNLNEFKSHLVEHYNTDLNTITYLTITYIKPRSSCWYENYSHIKRQNFKALESVKPILPEESNHNMVFSFFDKGYTEGLWRNDKNGFFYNLFPESKGFDFCDFTITINKYGDYLIKKGHPDYAVTNAFKNELEDYDNRYRN